MLIGSHTMTYAIVYNNRHMHSQAFMDPHHTRDFGEGAGSGADAAAPAAAANASRTTKTWAPFIFTAEQVSRDGKLRMDGPPIRLPLQPRRSAWIRSKCVQSSFKTGDACKTNMDMEPHVPCRKTSSSAGYRSFPPSTPAVVARHAPFKRLCQTNSKKVSSKGLGNLLPFFYDQLYSFSATYGLHVQVPSVKTKIRAANAWYKHRTLIGLK